MFWTILNAYILKRRVSTIKIRIMGNEQKQKEYGIVYGLPCCSASWDYCKILFQLSNACCCRVSCLRDPQYRTGCDFCFKFIASSGSVQICFSQLDMLWSTPGVRSCPYDPEFSRRLVWYAYAPAGKSRAFVSNLHGKIRKLPSRSMPERPTVTLDTRPPKWFEIRTQLCDLYGRC
jgi:hypothetical protein